jgi:uncharacterized 2Fe-2S/4Fe-4S cluster protein (DUF4445 family)
MAAQHYQIDFEPVGRRGTSPAGDTLLDAARRLGVGLINLCGGAGHCGRCRVQVLAGAVSEVTSPERDLLGEAELAAGYRLACLAVPGSDCKVRIPPESLSAPQRTQVEGQHVAAAPQPAVRAYDLALALPDLEDLRADADRVLDALAQEHGLVGCTADLEVLRLLPRRLRAQGWQASVAIRGGEVVALGPAGCRALGLAVDLGTTKIAVYVADLESGATLASAGLMNPQIAYGEDVIARISYADEGPEQAALLQSLVVDALNEAAAELCAEVGARPEEIVDAVVVGNTAMHHLFLRLPAGQLAQAPYVPGVRHALDIKARDLGLRIAPGAYVHLPPNIAGYVGSDHVAMLLASGIAQVEGVVLALDIGTNTEVCLANRGRLTSLSCASGPAFEGAHIQYGMRAANGAIEHVRLLAEGVEYQTIGDAPPVGLCGSGILDSLAQLHQAGVVDRNGRMGQHPRVEEQDGRRAFVLVSQEEQAARGRSRPGEGRPAITFSQKDVRELQLAKGAIRTGIQVLLETNGLAEGEIEAVIIAGAFGTYIDVESAIAIGMLPRLPLDRFRQVGNAAGMGARLALTSQHQRFEAEALARRIGYVELATAPGFTSTFAQSMYLGPDLFG